MDLNNDKIIFYHINAFLLFWNVMDKNDEQLHKQSMGREVLIMYHKSNDVLKKHQRSLMLSTYSMKSAPFGGDSLSIIYCFSLLPQVLQKFLQLELPNLEMMENMCLGSGFKRYRCPQSFKQFPQIIKLLPSIMWALTNQISEDCWSNQNAIGQNSFTSYSGSLCWGATFWD